MEPARLLDALEREGRLLHATAEGSLDAPVPACPGWVVADVLGHLGRVYRSVGGIVADRVLEPPAARVPKPPAGHAVLGFFAEGLEGLLGALRATPADVAVYTWAAAGTAGFYHRRMCHETAAHRIDVQTALGPLDEIDALDADVAADGVSELYEVVLPFGLARIDRPRPAGSLHLHRTDGVGEWTLSLVADELRVGHAHGEARAAVSGGGSDLFVFAWNRGRRATLEVLGDDSVADAWAALAP